MALLLHSDKTSKRLGVHITFDLLERERERERTKERERERTHTSHTQMLEEHTLTHKYDRIQLFN